MASPQHASASGRQQITLTQSQADKAQQEYERLLAEYEASRGDREPNPIEYYTYKALWFRAYGGDCVTIVPDLVADTTEGGAQPT